jgi:hypothetical protein
MVICRGELMVIYCPRRGGLPPWGRGGSFQVGLVVPVAEGVFGEAWNGFAAQVPVRCLQLSRDSREPQEPYQLTAILVWREHAASRAESAYLTWVMRIPDREAARFAKRRIPRAHHEIVDEHAIDQLSAHSHVSGGNAGAYGRPESAGEGGTETGWLSRLLADGHRIVAEWPARPGGTWPDIAAWLGMTPTACAVAHSRAVPELRVFLFTDRSAVIGGDQAIADAFDRDRRDQVTALTTLDQETFRRIHRCPATGAEVAGRRYASRAPRWSSAWACLKRARNRAAATSANSVRGTTRARSVEEKADRLKGKRNHGPFTRFVITDDSSFPRDNATTRWLPYPNTGSRVTKQGGWPRCQRTPHRV